MPQIVEFQMNRKLQDLISGVLSRQFAQFARTTLDESAARATVTSRETFEANLKGREHAAPRPGRPTTGGSFPSAIHWNPTRSAQGDTVEFDYATLDSKAPYWVIQEVGTGRSFKVLGGGGEGYAGTIRSQRGRGIPFGLQWGIGGAYVPPGAFDGAQLQPISTLKAEGRSVYAMRIRREIEGKHFVKLGGQEGFRFYEQSLRSEFRRIFQ